MHLLPMRALTALALAVPSVACTQVPHSARGSRSGSADSTASSAVTALRLMLRARARYCTR